MLSKKLDPAGAVRLARILEKYIKVNEPHAAKAMRRVVAELSVTALEQLRALPSLAADSIAIAMLMENPGMSDEKIAKRVGTSRSTLTRSPRYVRCRELLRAGRSESRSVTQE